MARASTFDVICPQCHHAVAASETHVGSVITCPDCLEEFVVSRPAESSQPVSKVVPEPLGDDFLFERSDGAVKSSAEPGENTTWDEDRLQLDALLKVDVSSAGNLQSGNPNDSDAPYDFTVVCPLCGTRQEAQSEQIGRTVRCPDCHSGYKIREPSRKARRPRNNLHSPDDVEIRLRDPEVLSLETFKGRGEPELPVSAFPPPASKLTPRIRTPEDASRDTLARAQKELDEQKRKERAPLRGNPMTGGLLRFLQQPSLVVRIFFISIGLWLELGAIEAATNLTNAGPLQQFASVMLRPFALIFGLLLASGFATLLLGIAQDTAQGNDEIESLPGVNPVEWFVESWPVFASLFLTLALSGVAAQAAYSMTGSAKYAFLLGMVPAGFLLATAFPVVLLSFLENSSPFSSVVWRGLQLAGKAWMVFMVQAFALVSLGMGLCLMRANSSSAIVNFIACTGLVFVSLLFFRLLGRLTWVCQEKSSEDARREPD